MQACRMWGTGKQAHMQKSLVRIYIGKPVVDLFKRAFLHLSRPSSLLMLTHVFSMVLISLKMGTLLNTNHNPCRKKYVERGM